MPDLFKAKYTMAPLRAEYPIAQIEHIIILGFPPSNIEEFVPFQHSYNDINTIHSAFCITVLETTFTVLQLHGIARIMRREPLHEFLHLGRGLYAIGVEIVACVSNKIDVIRHPMTARFVVGVQVVYNANRLDAVFHGLLYTNLAYLIL